MAKNAEFLELLTSLNVDAYHGGAKRALNELVKLKLEPDQFSAAAKELCDKLGNGLEHEGDPASLLSSNEGDKPTLKDLQEAASTKLLSFYLFECPIQELRKFSNGTVTELKNYFRSGELEAPKAAIANLNRNQKALEEILGQAKKLVDNHDASLRDNQKILARLSDVKRKANDIDVNKMQDSRPSLDNLLSTIPQEIDKLEKDLAGLKSRVTTLPAAHNPRDISFSELDQVLRKAKQAAIDRSHGLVTAIKNKFQVPFQEGFFNKTKDDLQPQESDARAHVAMMEKALSLLTTLKAEPDILEDATEAAKGLQRASATLTGLFNYKSVTELKHAIDNLLPDVRKESQPAASEEDKAKDEAARREKLGEAMAMLREAQRLQTNAETLLKQHAETFKYGADGDAEKAKIERLIQASAEEVKKLERELKPLQAMFFTTSDHIDTNSMFVARGSEFTTRVVKKGEAGSLAGNDPTIDPVGAVSVAAHAGGFEKRTLNPGDVFIATAKLASTKNATGVECTIKQDHTGKVTNTTPTATMKELTPQAKQALALEMAAKLLTNYKIGSKDGKKYITISAQGQCDAQLANMVYAAVLGMKKSNQTLNDLKIVTNIPGCTGPGLPGRFSNQDKMDAAYIKTYLPNYQQFLDVQREQLDTLTKAKEARIQGTRVMKEGMLDIKKTVADRFKSAEEMINKYDLDDGDTIEDETGVRKDLKGLNFGSSYDID